MTAPPVTRRLTVVTGHYGCGKTNLSINLALDLARERGQAVLVDLDVVNPYFRSSDYTERLAGHGVSVISPTFAGTTLDVPSLSGAVAGVFSGSAPVVFDVGGDDVGATAIGQYAAQIEAEGYEMLYVVNRYRNLTQTPAEAAELLREIESSSHLSATGVVNNSHLRDDTTLDTLIESLVYATETAALLGLPLMFTTVPVGLAREFAEDERAATTCVRAYPIQAYVRNPWETAPGMNQEELI
ncbi:MAG TPA: ParA family protein [Coriobacteriia bacterium]|nr:ParA family protein [Coriobacteriia bacterium]